jgi:hypothetical protein
MSVGMMNPQIHSPSELPPPDKNRRTSIRKKFNYYLIGLTTYEHHWHLVLRLNNWIS